MSGTDHRNTADWTAPGPVVVLVEPQMGENIGAAARAMWNFGLSRMRLVSPRDGWPNPAAIAMSSGAGRVLEEAPVFETTEQAVADYQAIYATTARPRGMTKRVLTPEAAMVEANGIVQGGGRVAVLFGPERAGLSNADVTLADTIISVPVNPAFASLNLAQCTLLISYEWQRQQGQTPPEEAPLLAQSGDVGQMIEHLRSELDAAGFFFPEAKRARMELSLENIFRRAPLTDQDVRTLRGVIRALSDGPRGSE